MQQDVSGEEGEQVRGERTGKEFITVQDEPQPSTSDGTERTL